MSKYVESDFVHYSTKKIISLENNIIRTRNNSLFTSNENMEKTWAIKTTIAQSAILNNFNPTRYFKYNLDEI